MATKYPIYVISKGRSSNPKTAFVLERNEIDYKICVEPEEYDNYCRTLPKERIIKLPENYSKRGYGSIPVRNFVWEHSINSGHKKHWILDDNIEDFNRLNRNTKFVVRTDATFRACEDFTDRYSNVALSGMNYYCFAKNTDKVPPYYLNTRIYSCILIDNSIKFRWRGKYNEDTDLSLRVLKAGYCTILFNAFLCGKISSMRNKGGNTDTIYNTGDNRLEFAESLKRQHPDVVEVVWKFNRWHHKVNYRPFKDNKLIKVDDTVYPKVDNYGMKIIRPKLGNL